MHPNVKFITVNIRVALPAPEIKKKPGSGLLRIFLKTAPAFSRKGLLIEMPLQIMLAPINVTLRRFVAYLSKVVTMVT